MGGDDVGPVVAVRVQDEPLPLDGPVVVAALSEAFQSHDGAVSDSHSLVDNTTPASANLKQDGRDKKSGNFARPGQAALQNI